MIDETIDGTIDGTIDETIDEVCIYKPCQYNYLWSTSWLFLVTTGYTVYQQKYDFVIFPSGIFLTSLNYWKQPKLNSWERNLDIGYVYYSIVYNLFRSIGAQEANKLYTYFVIGLLFYMLSNYNHRHNRLYVSALCHSFVHLFGNIALIYLYSGHIDTVWDNALIQKMLYMLEYFTE